MIGITFKLFTATDGIVVWPLEFKGLITLFWALWIGDDDDNLFVDNGIVVVAIEVVGVVVDDDLLDERFFDDKRLLRGVRRIDDLNDPCFVFVWG